ncbi:hypothetical protein KIN20_031483 [Parelaphostrongylus tenuis]|uniref:Pyrroline-5-carboxylate reductase n=1 Tax=Parelaphostrongylus tenuis TaxID=148309 RepID=A0AAD5R578_PARTN|nr:hypothetical protein KIN20_031483 [Parelaphostrongylus tenuis]
MSEFHGLCLKAGIVNPMLLFVGGGNMASSLISGSIATGIIVLSVKPQSRHEVFDSIKRLGISLEGCPLVISILAGIGITTLQEELSVIGFRGPVIRLMPNTAATICSSASIISAPDNTNDQFVEIVEELASKVGMCLRVDSKNFNAYATIGGSAPAWVYMFIESLADGGVLAGCSRETALKLAAQSVMGAAQMVLATGEHPAALKDKVCSPAGTTISGLRKLEEHGFRSAVIEAVKAASDTANSMS